MYYDKDTLREVYFLSEFSNYFMSCRTDMSTISHYYIKKIPDSYYFLIKRYENNIYNRAYVIINNNLTASYSRVDSVERIYKSYPAELSLDLSKKIQGDLLMFLSKFNKFGLSDLFSPQEH
jgi:murein tripeptide amidase MpaA